MILNDVRWTFKKIITKNHLIKTAATMKTAGWPKPEKASEIGIIRRTTADKRMVKATISYRYFPHKKPTKAKIIKKSKISWLISI